MWTNVNATFCKTEWIPSFLLYLCLPKEIHPHSWFWNCSFIFLMTFGSSLLKLLSTLFWNVYMYYVTIFRCSKVHGKESLPIAMLFCALELNCYHIEIQYKLVFSFPSFWTKNNILRCEVVATMEIKISRNFTFSFFFPSKPTCLSFCFESIIYITQSF